MNTTSILSTLALLVALAIPATAQIAVEVRGGTTAGNYVPLEAGFEQANPGAAFGATLEWRARSFFSVYAAASTYQFGCTEGFCTGTSVDVSGMSYGGGVRLHPSSLPWIRAGVAFYGTEAIAEGGTISTDPSLGYEIGTGITIPFGSVVRLLPGVFVRTQPGDERTTMAGAEIGLQLTFGS